MAAVREMVRVSARSPFSSGGSEVARNGSLKLCLDFWINGRIYPNSKESLISSISQLWKIMVNRINLITDSQIKREKDLTFGVIAKFDFAINS
jgi:hypothetical protein